MQPVCPSCGAQMDANEVRLYCGQCGARVAEGVADLAAYRTAPERFERVQVAPGYGAAMQRNPTLAAARELARPLVHFAGGLVFLVGLLVVAAQKRDVQGLLAVALVGGVWLVIAGRALGMVLARVGARTRRLIAVIDSDRYVGGGGRGSDPAGVCEYRVVLRLADRSSRAAFAEGALIGEIAVGDIGVAYVRRDRLLDYRWFDVMAPPLQPGEIPRAPGCPTCGAAQPFGPVSATCCYCGQPLPHPDLGEFGARFRAAAASDAAAAACRKRIRGGVPLPRRAFLLMVLGGLLIAVEKLVWPLVRAAMAHWGWFVLVAAGPWLALVGGAVWLWFGTAPYRAGLAHELAVVVGTRKHLRRNQNDKETWQHFVTVAGPSGARRELLAKGDVAGRLARGQLGVAHRRGTWLADFTVLDPAPDRAAGPARAW